MKVTVQVAAQNAFHVEANAVAYFLPENFSKKDIAQDILDCGFDVLSYLKDVKFTGAKGSVTSFPLFLKDKSSATHILFAGLGKKNNHFCLETMRRALGSVVKTVQAKQLEKVAVSLPESSLFSVSAQEFIQQMHVIATIAGYKFDKFIDTSKEEKSITVELCAASADQPAVEEGQKSGSIIGQAVNQARCWIDMPPSQLTPTDLADHAKKIADESGLTYTVFNEDEIKKMGMGGLAGVSAGSSQDAKFVILEYKSGNNDAPTLGFVGKGITFDSGGLSLKPANYMETMKEDMSGASSVINTMGAIGKLKPNVNVVGLVALSENMPGDSATKPGDILTFYNGKTAEVRNTDAEGRLILADALAYGVKHYKLDCIIDVATLTGACIYAVGPFYSALLSDNDDLASKVNDAAQRAGDYVWRLPFTDDFKAAIKSDVADIQNVGNSAIAAGTITAAWFLRNFTADTPWVHLDIASTAFNVPNISYYGKGATGSSVRLLIDLAMNWKK